MNRAQHKEDIMATEEVVVTAYVPYERGTIGVLIEGFHLTKGGYRMWFDPDHIPYTNLRPRPLLRGWLGTTNDYHREALGVWAVEEYRPEDQTLVLRPATEPEIRQWLEARLPDRWAWMTDDLVEQALPQQVRNSHQGGLR